MGRSIVDIGPLPDGYVAGSGVGVEPSSGMAGQRLAFSRGWGGVERLASPNAFTSPITSGGEH